MKYWSGDSKECEEKEEAQVKSKLKVFLHSLRIIKNTE